MRGAIGVVVFSVHSLLDRSVLVTLPSNININNSNGARRRGKGNDNQSGNNRPRQNARVEPEPIPCCNCSKWGKCSLLRPNKGCPCVAAKRPFRVNRLYGCAYDCQNQAPRPAQPRADAPSTEHPPETTVRTSNSRRTLPRRSRRQRASTDAGTAEPFVFLAPTENTTTPVAPLAITGDASAATNTATEASTTNPLIITAGEGGGGETSAAAVGILQITAGDGGNDDPLETEVTAIRGGDSTQLVVIAEGDRGQIT